MALVKRGSVFHYQFMIDGIRYRGSTKEVTKSKAQQYEALLIAKIRTEGGNPQLKKPPILSELAKTFFKYIDSRVEANHLEPNSRHTYRHGWRLLSQTKVALMRIDQIATTDAEMLKFPGSPSNGNQALRTLRRMLSYASELGYMRAAPRIRLLEEHGRTALIETTVEQLLLASAPLWLADAIVIMLDCGMRPEEVFSMRWENVFWDRSAILVPFGKSYRAKRYVGMTDRMRQRLLARQSEAEGSDWVFPARTAASGHRAFSSKAWRDTLKLVRAEVQRQKLPAIPDGLVLYSARHTFATNFLANGGDLAKLMVLMGHASITTTQKYLHPSIADAAEVMNRHNLRKGLTLVKSA